MEILTQLQKLCDQDAYLELHSNSKRPVSNDWPNQGKSADTVLSKGNNIGLILGVTSGLLDLDLDCRESKSLADIILPVPIGAFDRGTTDSGNYLYKATTTGPRKSFTAADKSTLVELRGDGSQTMMPPSVHPHGVQLAFTSLNEEAKTVDYVELLKVVNPPGTNDGGEDKEWELFDCQEDPMELFNRYNDHHYQDVVFEMKKLLEDKMRSIGDRIEHTR